MTKIIGITGVAGAGKDTVASAMARSLKAAGHSVEISSYAEPIREISRRVGLEPFGRRMKEKVKCLVWDDFSDDLFDAIEDVLGHLLEDNDRALLYSYTIDYLKPFVYNDSTLYAETINCIDLSPREFMQIFGTEGGQAVRRTLWVELAEKRWSASGKAVVICPDVRFPHELPPLDRLVAVVRPGTERINAHSSESMAWRITRGILSGTIVPVEQLNYLANLGTKEELEAAAADYAMELTQ